MIHQSCDSEFSFARSWTNNDLAVYIFNALIINDFTSQNFIPKQNSFVKVNCVHSLVSVEVFLFNRALVLEDTCILPTYTVMNRTSLH
jgi:hypothetical protein